MLPPSARDAMEAREVTVEVQYRVDGDDQAQVQEEPAVVSNGTGKEEGVRGDGAELGLMWHLEAFLLEGF